MKAKLASKVLNCSIYLEELYLLMLICCKRDHFKEFQCVFPEHKEMEKLKQKRPKCGTKTTIWITFGLKM